MKKTITDNPLVTLCTYGRIRLTSKAITAEATRVYLLAELR